MTMTQRGLCAAALCLLSACATRLDPAPVVDMSAGTNPNAQAAMAAPGPLAPVAAAPVPLGPPPPGYYRVRPGDTLYSIARSNGRSGRDLIAWNNLPDPNHIEVDQVLRVVPPGEGGAMAAAPAPATVSAGPAPAPAVAPAVAAADDSAPAPDAGSLALAWPVRGPLLGRFNDSTNKGIDIGGTAGEPVRAATGGRVVYAGNGLRGYGNLVIVKSNATYLTAYAHNRDLKVKEGDTVSKGQVIADMGSTDSDHVMLHFELRRDGKPIDPLRYLPPQ
ncbi:peptidoglycan DD-metalloendopeptidase family protein [Paraburkholderia acidipaludis]|uniref:peptidoglycan DD-metalloendopeptidase family protein n=1 Tax=Paraburkholderia acidipaludis TaxID=660537 RepID=UPI000A4A7A1D|nr:peptidoglycan DD-metalloendopeptidase family protein [Paraburkholderia acidipaludis]